MNRTIIVTGASGSMGAAAVKSLVSNGDKVIMACRNLSKADSVRSDIIAEVPEAEIDVLKLDVASAESIRGFADSLSGIKIDALFNNAGVISREYGLSKDGFENTVATNYIGPYLLTRLLIPQMNEGANIVNMVSLTHKYGKVDERFFDRKAGEFNRLTFYSDTKLALLLFSISLTEKYKNIKVNVSDPGIVNSNMISMGRWFDPLADIFFRPFCRTPEKGVTPALKALVSETNKEYFVGKRHFPIAAKFVNHPYKEWLWNQTEQLVNI